MRPLDFSHVTPSFSDGIELSPTRNKFLVREKTRARMHDIRTEFLVRVYRTSFLDGELGSSVMGLSVATSTTSFGWGEGGNVSLVGWQVTIVV